MAQSFITTYPCSILNLIGVALGLALDLATAKSGIKACINTLWKLVPEALLKEHLLFTNREVWYENEMSILWCREIKEGALFCDNCGQAIDVTNGTKQNTDAFWQKENSQKQKEVVEQISGFKGKCEQTQGAFSVEKS